MGLKGNFFLEMIYIQQACLLIVLGNHGNAKPKIERLDMQAIPYSLSVILDMI